jgi:hypothetical protein
LGLGASQRDSDKGANQHLANNGTDHGLVLLVYPDGISLMLPRVRFRRAKKASVTC